MTAPASIASTCTPTGSVTVLTIWYVRGSISWSSLASVSWTTTVSVGLLDVERGAGVGDPDEAGHLARCTIHLADDPVGSADEPGAAVVRLGADGGAAVRMDRGDDHRREGGDDEADDDHFT